MDWLGWQIDYLIFLQNFREVSGHVFDNFFLGITMFGEIFIPILFMTFIYWCVNKNAGIYILWSYTFGFITNLFLKTTACIYRPWILDSRIQPIPQAIPAATGYSFPSGHTAGAVTTWGGTAVAFWQHKYIRYLCLGLILLVMFSRNYAGVHTPQDVIVSLFVSIFILFCVKKILEWEKQGENRDLFIIALIGIINILLLLYVNLKSYPCDCFGGKLLFDPTPVKIESFARIGTALGIFCGWLLEKRFVNFNPSTGSVWKKLVRFIVGIAVLSLINFFGKDLCIYVLGNRTGIFVNSVILGLFITFIYPYFIKS